MGFLAWLKSLVVQDLGLFAPGVKEQGGAPYDCAPNQREYSGFAGWNNESPFHYKPFHLLMICDSMKDILTEDPSLFPSLLVA
jgi:hypothetical protein